jgi:fermentation-respiration switch protein FrsA (DUF1100 family)
VQIDPYVFFAGDIPLAARIYRTERDGPAVLVTGSWLTVKEQMADGYARALADRGYTAITFDFSGYGESGGTPRQAEIPARKIADIREVARQATLLFGAVGYLAICASAQYVLTAIAEGAPIASFASVAGWFHDPASVAPFYGGMPGVDARLERARAALREFLRDGTVRTVPAYESGNDAAGMFFELDYYANSDRGNIPQWTNEMAEFSWIYWLGFDGLSAASRVSVPTLFVHSDDCVLPDNVRSLADRLAGPTELVWAEGGQTDFYDQPDQVALAIDAADAHFRKDLAP